MALAGQIVERDGVDALTMAALADAADYAPASLYTYFSSRSALLAALQTQALQRLGAVADAALAGWSSALATLQPAPEPRTAALVRLVAFSDLFLAAPQRHPYEFRLQQQLLVTDGVQDPGDLAAIVPVAFHVLDVPRRLLAAAVEAGALTARAADTDPIDQPLDGALVRTLTWITALNGALLVDGLTAGVPVTGALLGDELTDALLIGWGADRDGLTAARAFARQLPDDGGGS